MSFCTNNFFRFSIADNDFYFKEILTGRILASPGFSVARSCNNGRELVSRAYLRQEDFFLVNLFMPVMSGMEAIRFLRELKIEKPIIAYAPTYQEDIAMLLKSHKNIVYCEKKAETVLLMIDFVLRKTSVNYEEYIKTWEEKQLLSLESDRKRIEEGECFSITEIQVMKLCYEGLSNQEIGVFLHLSPRTIEGYFSRLFKKVGARNKVDLIRYAIECGYYNMNI